MVYDEVVLHRRRVVRAKRHQQEAVASFLHHIVGFRLHWIKWVHRRQLNRVGSFLSVFLIGQ